jgi:hypothetical protein
MCRNFGPGSTQESHTRFVACVWNQFCDLCFLVSTRNIWESPVTHSSSRWLQAFYLKIGIQMPLQKNRPFIPWGPRLADTERELARIELKMQMLEQSIESVVVRVFSYWTKSKSGVWGRNLRHSNRRVKKQGKFRRSGIVFEASRLGTERHIRTLRIDANSEQIWVTQSVNSKICHRLWPSLSKITVKGMFTAQLLDMSLHLSGRGGCERVYISRWEQDQ